MLANDLNALTLALIALALLAVLVALWFAYRFFETRKRLANLFRENDASAKMLVRRDLELTEKNARLLELDEMKSDFVSVAAHQLRTPITGIRWTFQALLDGSGGALSPEQEKITQQGLKVTMNAVELIKDLLDVARIEEGRFGYELARHPLSATVSEAVAVVRPRAEEKAITLEVKIPEELPDAVFDSEKILIVFNNIFENAVKYTPPGGHITASAHKDGKKVVFSIADTGIGIPKDDVKKAATKFFRADNAKLFQTSGTGLGLYVVKNIIERHGGEFSLESEENKGTTVTFSLPAAV